MQICGRGMYCHDSGGRSGSSMCLFLLGIFYRFLATDVVKVFACFFRAACSTVFWVLYCTLSLFVLSKQLKLQKLQGRVLIRVALGNVFFGGHRRSGTAM